MTTLHNIAIGFSGSKNAKMYKIEDFVPNWTGIEEEPAIMSLEDMKQFWIDFAEQQNEQVRIKQEQQTVKKGK